MSRFFNFFVVFAILAVFFMNAEAGPANKAAGGVTQSCGRNLANRVVSICGSPCFGEGTELLVSLACGYGVTDDQLAALCCPQ